MVRSGRAPAWLGALLVAAGCTDTGSDIGGSSAPTVISVDPQLFLGDVRCSKAPGGMQTFLATVRDSGPLSAPFSSPFVLPSSPPTPCSVVAEFLYVVPGHQYAADIWGYDVGLEPGQMQPRGCKAARDALAAAQAEAAKGEPTAEQKKELARLDEVQRSACGASAWGDGVERPDGTPLEPLWTWTPVAPEDAQPPCTHVLAVAVEHETVPLGRCMSLQNEPPSSVTGIAVDPSAALGALTCKTAKGGDVATFDVIPTKAAWAPASGVKCGETAPPYTAGVEPGQTYDFRVAAHADAKGPVTWASHCFTVAEEGLTVGVTCDPLTDRGELSVSTTEVGLGNCPKGWTVEITLGHAARPLVFRPMSCEQPAVLVGVPAGDYSASIDLADGDGAPKGYVTCSVTIVPDETASPTDCKSML